MGSPTCKTLVMGVTGSVGAVVVPNYIRLFRQALADDVYVVMSKAATRFITPYSLSLLSDHEVIVDSFEAPSALKVPHIQLGAKADLVLIAPATANILGKAACGICDDMISTLLISTRAPIIFAPNMNEIMWTSPVVQRNVETLRALGHIVLDPVQGFEIADGSNNIGAMLPPMELLKVLSEHLKARPSDPQ